MIPRSLIPALFAAFGLLATFLQSAAATELACVSGHGTVVPPCSFDSGVLSLDSGTTPNLGQGGGHNTQVIFSGPTFTIEADVAGGHAAYNSNDLGTGTNTGTVTFTISTVSGLPLIDDLSFALIDPFTTGTGGISWSLGSVIGSQIITSGELFFLTPQSSITETLSVTLTSGANGDASLVGGVFDVSLVPEPSSLAVFGAALGVFGLLRRRKRVA